MSLSTPLRLNVKLAQYYATRPEEVLGVSLADPNDTASRWLSNFVSVPDVCDMHTKGLLTKLKSPHTRFPNMKNFTWRGASLYLDAVRV